MDQYSTAIVRRQSRDCDQRLLAIDKAHAIDPTVRTASQVRLEPSESITYEPKHEVVVYFGTAAIIAAGSH